MIIAFEHYTSAESRLGALIKMWEKYPYVHVELIFEEHDWVCFSSRTKEDGVYLKPFNDVILTPDHWKGYRLPVVSEVQTYEVALGLIGKEFNYEGIANSQILKNFRTNPKRRFCSQAVYEVLKSSTNLPFPDTMPQKVTPKLLHGWILQLGYPEVTLTK